MRENKLHLEDEDVAQLSDMLEIQEIDADDFINEAILEAENDDNDIDLMDDSDDDDDEDEAQKMFVRHYSPIFGLDLNFKYNLGVSGDQDDKAFVWNTDTQQVYVEITLKDTITNVRFSFDANLLAICDLSGNLVVYKISIETKSNDNQNNDNSASSSAMDNNELAILPGFSFVQIFKQSIGDTDWITWHFGANVLFAGTKDTGEIYMWNIPSGECKIMPGVGSSSELGGITEDGKKIVSVYANGMLKLWDAKSCQAIFTHYIQENGLTDPQVLAVSKDTAIFAAGDTEGNELRFY